MIIIPRKRSREIDRPENLIKSPWISIRNFELGTAYTYHIHGQPTPTQRARKSPRAMYDPQRDLKMAIRIEIERQHNNKPMLQGPLRLDAHFIFQPPPSNMKIGNRMLDCFHIYKPDVDNLQKWIQDLCTGIVYKDDCSISTSIINKYYGEKSYTYFTLTELREYYEAKEQNAQKEGKSE